MGEKQRFVPEAYTSLAAVYDLFMEDVPYDVMVEALQDFWRQEGCQVHTVLDAGCGTGSFIVPLAKAGFDTCGVDLSSEMLAMADHKAYNEGVSCLFIERDLRELHFAPQFDAVISFFDTLNYILTATDLEKVMTGIYQCLLPGGSFVFDVRTLHYYADVLGENLFRDEKNGCCLIWQNHFADPHVFMELDFFLPNGKGQYLRYQEEHTQQGYALCDLVRLLRVVGFKNISLSGDFHGGWQEVPCNEPENRLVQEMERQERVFFACRK